MFKGQVSTCPFFVRATNTSSTQLLLRVPHFIRSENSSQIDCLSKLDWELFDGTSRQHESSTAFMRLQFRSNVVSAYQTCGAFEVSRRCSFCLGYICTCVPKNRRFLVIRSLLKLSSKRLFLRVRSLYYCSARHFGWRKRIAKGLQCKPNQCSFLLETLSRKIIFTLAC